MKTKIAKTAAYWLGVVALGLVLGLSIQFVTAWTEPTAAPPGGNVGAPVNTGSTGQVKEGNLILNSLGLYSTGLLVNGNVHVTGGELDVATRDPNTGAIITPHNITGVAAPVLGTDAVNKDYVKDYVDAQSGGGTGIGACYDANEQLYIKLSQSSSNCGTWHRCTKSEVDTAGSIGCLPIPSQYYSGSVGLDDTGNFCITPNNGSNGPSWIMVNATTSDACAISTWPTHIYVYACCIKGI